jgi:CxxC motif-containing protein (DUF1111 family)
VRANSKERRPGRNGMARTVLFLAAAMTPSFALAREGSDSSSGGKVQALARLGEELFNREWAPRDARSPGGDGLGPLYNEKSCIACHHLGAAGGAGPSTKNIMILTVIADRRAREVALLNPPRVTPGSEKSPVLASMFAFVRSENERLAKQAGGRQTSSSTRSAAVPTRAETPANRPASATVEGHPGFKTATSITLHHFGTNPAYGNWRSELLGLGTMSAPTLISDEKTASQRVGTNGKEVSTAHGNELMARSQTLKEPIAIGAVFAASSKRNTTPLFGSGLINAISDAAIEAAAKAQAASKTFPAIHGRVSRLPDGRIGRFGWKGQIASLEDFVLTACAVELGLEVPGHHQSSDPLVEEKRAPGLDLSEDECAALTSYVASLPAPAVRVPSTPVENEQIAVGRDLFTSIGCASCHRPDMDKVVGLYSDLLLHDMGPTLADAGSYSSHSDWSGSGVSASRRNEQDARPQGGRASRQEWRTPPLWGIRDSGPYLHDGRATTFEQAIAIHGGEGQASADAFASLETQEKAVLMTFLKSLVAPNVTMARRDLP